MLAGDVRFSDGRLAEPGQVNTALAMGKSSG
jgi:hypothetical protein